MKYVYTIFVIIQFFVAVAYAEEEKLVSNAMLLEKIELYQKMNDTRLEIQINELKRLREDMNNRFNMMREEVKTNLELIREDMNKRFEQVDKRFEQIDKRFEQVDKRFEQVDKRFEQIDKRFEQVDKRIEQVDKHIENVENRIDFNQQLILFLLTLTLATPIGIELWRKQAKKKTEESQFDVLTAICVEYSKLDERFRTAIQKVKEQGIALPQNMAYAF